MSFERSSDALAVFDAVNFISTLPQQTIPPREMTAERLYWDSIFQGPPVTLHNSLYSFIDRFYGQSASHGEALVDRLNSADQHGIAIDTALMCADLAFSRLLRRMLPHMTPNERLTAIASHDAKIARMQGANTLITQTSVLARPPFNERDLATLPDSTWYYDSAQGVHASTVQKGNYLLISPFIGKAYLHNSGLVEYNN